MEIDAILGSGIAIFFFGLSLGLPNLSSELLYDFSTLSTVPLNTLRIGLIVIGFYFLNTGLEARE